MDWNKIITLLDNNPGILWIIGIIISTILVFLGGKKIINSKKTHNNFLVGRDIVKGNNNKITNKTTYNKTTIKTTKLDNLAQFTKYLDESKWKREFINNKETWVCDKNNLYQIEIGDNHRDFKEKWTEKFPDKNGSGAYSVYLKINNTSIKELIFIYMDGGRICVPLPETNTDKSIPEYYWNSKSLRFKVGKIIGEYYIYHNIYGVANHIDLKII